jgi:radical SAM protein with 4Fe4S-binding SPASM domain
LNDQRFSDLRVLRWHHRITGILAGRPLGPIRAAIDLTNICNHDCPWCEPAAYREETIRDRKHTLDTDVALAALQSLAMLGCKTINFSGGGEPTVHPDFGKILVRAIELGMRTWVVTNGSLMHKWPELSKAHHVRVSLDASTAAEHKLMHGARDGQFDTVLDNIRALKGPEVGIGYVVADCNSSEVSFLRSIRFANSFADFIHFRPLSEAKPKRFTDDWNVLAQVIASVSEQNPGCAHVMILGKRWKDVFHQREFDKCYAAVTTTVIGANGDVQACCDRRDLVFGNLYKQRFDQIWQSYDHTEKAALIAPKLCGTCLMCGTNKAIQDYVVENKALPELI